MNSFAKKVIFACFCMLLLLVVLEVVFIQAELFRHFPHIGIGFHFVGGLAIAIMSLYAFRPQLILLKSYMQSMFMLGCVGLAAIGWEGFEWAFSAFYYTNNLQGSLDNTMGDLYVGMVGGIVACIINYWKPLR